MNLASVLCVLVSMMTSASSILQCVSCDNPCLPRTIDQWEKEFHSNFSPTINPDVMQRLLVPWKYEKQEDPTRLPKDIWTATCEPKYCQTKMLGSMYRHVQPIIYNVTVYYKELCEDRTHYKLVPRTFPLTAGCTCRQSKRRLVSSA